MERCKISAVLYHKAIKSDQLPFIFDKQELKNHLYFLSI